MAGLETFCLCVITSIGMTFSRTTFLVFGVFLFARAVKPFPSKTNFTRGQLGLQKDSLILANVHGRDDNVCTDLLEQFVTYLKDQLEDILDDYLVDIEKVGVVDPENKEHESNKNFPCGIPQVKNVTKIVGGTVATPHFFPWMVLLRIPDGDLKYVECGGSLISSTHILTAAHCLKKDWREIKIGLGLHDSKDINGNWLTIKSKEQVVIHEAYDNDVHFNDLAVIKLDRRVKFTSKVLPICLPNLESEADAPGTPAYAAGWGDTAEKAEIYSNVLNQLEIVLLQPSLCAKVYKPPTMGFDSEKQLCAGFPFTGSHDTCQGDSGGPLQVLDENDRWTLVGIVSSGQGCARQQYPGIYTRVSSYLHWILEKTKL